MAEATCQQCGDAFPQRRGGPHAGPPLKYCSDECRRLSRNRRYREGVRAPTAPRACEGCGAEFMPYRNSARFCGRACASREWQRQNGNHEVAPLERPCGWCDQQFRNPDSRVDYCGNECARLARNARNRAPGFGLSVSEYKALLAAQSGRCLVCRRTEKTERSTGRKQALAIDHDHVTGQVRGLLCCKCNRAIGLLCDDPQIIRAALRYVESHRQLTLAV